jgi:hypothetical protein
MDTPLTCLTFLEYAELSAMDFQTVFQKSKIPSFFKEARDRNPKNHKIFVAAFGSLLVETTCPTENRNRPDLVLVQADLE